jgi:hypothetical protein
VGELVFEDGHEIDVGPVVVIEAEIEEEAGETAGLAEVDVESGVDVRVRGALV